MAGFAREAALRHHSRRSAVVATTYLDASALVKRYVAEVGSAWVRRLVARPLSQVLYTAALTEVEVRSALQRLVREGCLDTAQAQRLTQWGFVNLLRLSLSADALRCHPGPAYPGGGPLRTCHLGPTLETLPHLWAVRSCRPPMPSRSTVVEHGTIRGQKALGMSR